jgi:general secretion pathway protein H
MQRQRGLTLLELLVVLAIIGLVMAGVSLSLRDSSQTQLEREAQRLVAQLEAARAQSRTSGVALVWRITPNGYEIARMPAQPGSPTRQETWLSASTQALIQAPVKTNAAPTPNTAAIVLGPEPIISPASITLSVPAPAANATRSPQTLRIATDGLRPFQVVP